ncbi:hypothetical protein [Ruminococcus flavefaciens]|uniref:beta strand repeat-containing protein n=1 Tax=Ruminococcus flavefaciens TaxID=1265 RepID=UPI0026E997C9|nr:hypothetical protein [Ruminococcus flavefaciens]
MKKTRHSNKIFKRVVSMATALVLLSGNLPMQEIGNTFKLIDFSRFTITANATPSYDVSTFEETVDGVWENKVIGMNMSESQFAEYSRCYHFDSGFASRHSGDVITLSPTSEWMLQNGSEQFYPLGTTTNPFAGTIRVNAIDSTSMLLLMDAPFFDVVYDTVQIYKGNTSDSFTLEFIKTASNENPLMANEVRHSGTGGAVWKAMLSGRTIEKTLENGSKLTYGNSYSYGGVIGKMNDGAVLTLSFTDDTTSAQASVKRSTAQGILCGEMASGSSLTASYTNSTERVIGVGDGSNSNSGGLVGTMTGANFTLTSASGLNFDAKSGTGNAGLLVGYAVKDVSNNSSSISLPDELTVSGSATGSGEKVGGLVGSLQNSDITIADNHTITLSGVTVTGGNKVGGIIGNFEPSTKSSKALTENVYTLTNCSIGGSAPGGIIGEYTSVGGESVDVSHFTFTGTTMSSGNAGGVFGKYTAAGDTTITGTFSAPSASTHFGGVIGEYTSGALARTLNLNSLIVNSVNQTANTKKLGGVILNVADSSYINVSSLTVGVIGGADKSNTSNLFGGIVSTLGSSAANGCFVDVIGNFTLTTGSSYNGGAVAGSFKNGVLRLAGNTDISGAQTANGYGQLIYENDTTLVYSKGDGSDAAWTFNRNSSTTASDLGQWGEVVRFSNMETDIVEVNPTAHTVTLKAASTSVSNTTTFAKLALNMQLNDGAAHGALLFAQGGDTKTTLLSSNSITFSGTIDLSGTGILGLMRDGGNGCYYDVNNTQNNSAMKGNPDYFTGTITGTNAEIKLAVGKSYGTGNTNGGKIYLSHNNGHSAQGLLSFADGATISGLTVSGTMNAERVDNAGDALHMGAVMGYMTNGASLTNVSVSTKIDFTRSHENGRIYIGGVAGLFDGDGTGTLSIIGGTASASAGSIAPEITLNGGQAAYSEDNYSNRNTYTGGILGLLGGKTTSQYSVEIKYTDVSPKITLGSDVADVNDQYCGGMIGRVRENTTNERSIEISDVTMTSSEVELKSLYSGGLLGTMWDRTQVTINGLSISGTDSDKSKVTNKHSGQVKLSGLVFRATGKWNVNSLSVSNADFTASSSTNAESFGLIVNQGYRSNDGLYLNLKNSGYSLSGVTLPSSAKNDYYVDEIVANTASGKDAVVNGGNGVGIININMTTSSNTNVNITDIKDDTTGQVTAAGTGTYQNKTLNNDKLISNQHARYYYNLDVINAKAEQSDGEKFLMWSIYNYYAPTNIKGYNVITNASITGLTNVDLRGLSYYPVDIAGLTLPAATFRFGFDDIMTLETDKGTDSWARYPDSTGDMKTSNETRRNQHYLMQNSLFGNVTGALSTSGAITLKGVFGGFGNAGVLVGNTLTGNVDLTKGVTLDNTKPFSPESPMLVNYINGTTSGVDPQFRLTGLRIKNYPSTDTPAVASALIHNAEGTGMKIIFSDIQLDARDGTINSGITTDAATKMNTAYGTSRSIFQYATLIRNLKSNSSDTIEYNYTWDEDWGTVKVNGEDVAKRYVTYGKEVNVATNVDYPYYYKAEELDEGETGVKSGERRYSGTKRTFTNPVDGSDVQFDFSTGFLPYVYNKSTDTTYDICEVKVNYVSTGLVEGCGTYNDPYIITSASLLTKVASYINSENAMLDTIRLPNALNASWHEENTGDSLYKKSSDSYVKNDNNDSLAITAWTKTNAREYLAGAYYVIPNDMELPSTFPGIGIGGANENGKTVFHGVIVGQKSDSNVATNHYPTITNLSDKPFICISNGSVVKNLNFTIDNKTPPDTKKPDELVKAILLKQNVANSTASLYGYGISFDTSVNTTARCYGGVFGEIMGGDNIIDNVAVIYTNNRPIKLPKDSNGIKHLISVGGFAGCIVNGGLIFRGNNSVTNFKVYNNTRDNNVTINSNDKNALAEDFTKNLYANPYVGRVINGYAVNEGTSTLNNTNKHYTIDSISVPTEANKLDVDFEESTISVPNAQALFVMSLITQSTAGTAESPAGDYGVSQSYGVNSGYFCGSNHLGTYDYVGSKKTVHDDETGEDEEVMYTTQSEIADYYNKASKDVANDTDTNRTLAVPYIISAYTKAYSGTYPARCVTTTGAVKKGVDASTNNKFWDISLKEDGDFQNFGNYTSFRGIGSVGLRSNCVWDNNKNDHDKANKYNMKIASFDGKGNTISLSIKMTRYLRNQENYFYTLNISETPSFSAKWPSNYGIDSYSESLLGLGLFNMTWTKNSDSSYRDFTLTGFVKDVCYKNDGSNVTGVDGNSQLYAVGGVVGQGYYGFYQNFDEVYFDGLTIDGSYACGGLIGMNADTTGKDMIISKCNSVGNGVSVTGGYFGTSDAPRIGIGSLVGMSLGTKVRIDGADPEKGIEKSNMYISRVDTHYTGEDNRCVVGGLIGYTGQGAVIKNVNIVALDNNAAIGADNVAIVGGILGLTQRHEDITNRDNTLVFENCSLTNISVKARRCAGGLFGRSWHNAWGASQILIKDCKIIGNGTTSTISASGSNTSNPDDIVGGLMGQINAQAGIQSIENCSVSGYTIKGYNVGGLVGHVRHQGNDNGTGGTNTKVCIIKNSTVENCNIQGKNYCGGLIGENRIYISGYNIYTKNVIFTDWEKNDKTSEAGAFIGANVDINRQIRLIAVAKYADSDKVNKVPTDDIKTNPGTNSFIVFSDYTGQSLTTDKNTSNISSFGKTDIGDNITDQNKAPYLTLNPSSSMGTGEYISGDGAAQLSEALTGYSTYSSGKSAAARIYADWSAASNKPNRAFSNVTVTAPYSGAAVPDIGTFFKQSADSGEFKVSTWNTEMGTRTGVDDFTLLVVNDANDPETTTNLIDNYIRLMTGTTTHYMADATGKYRIVITPCRYNSETHKFEIVSNVIAGLSKGTGRNGTDGKIYTNGYYQMSLTNADSKYDDQFTLIDVQYYDPTDTSADASKRIAYHLYVPVLTKKTVNIEFSAASLSGSEYRMLGYSDKITREIAGGKNANNPTTLVDSMDVWTTTYIRFSYPVSQVNEILKLGSDLQWNHDKKVNIYWGMENNIPDNAKMVLVDPNNNADKAYYATAGQFTVADRTRTVDFSEFTARSNGTGGNFHEQTLYSRLYDKVTEQANTNGKGAYNPATSSTSGALEFKVNGEIKYYTSANGTGSVDLVVTEPINEDYYLSLLVPKTSGQADVVQIQPAGMANTVNHEGNAATGNVIRATVTSKLNAALIIGDFYRHTVSDFYVTSALNSQIITEANKVLTTTSTATISLIDNEEHTQAAYFANVLSNAEHLYHSFNLQMIRSNSEGKNDDIIKGIEKNNISATYKINNGTEQIIPANGIIRETSYIQCTTGDIKSYLVSEANNYSVTITGVAVLDFDSYADEFPSNPNELDNIGVRGAVRSNISYQEDNLPYSKMYAPHDPVAPYFYTKEDSSALFSFDAVDELDDEEIGTNTKNNSRLGVNDKFVYNNLIHGKSVYNALDVKDYTNATSVTYTLELFRKTTANGSTDYVQVNMPEYITDIELTDTETGNLTKTEHTKTVGAESVTYYEYSRNVDPNGADKDAMFYTDFACLVKKGDDSKKEYANYKIQLTVRLNGSTNNERTSYIIYTNAKIDPTMIDEVAS